MTDNPQTDHQQTGHRRTDDRPRPGRGWRDRAACRDVDVDADLFFPAAESGPAHDAQVAAAKAVCARCPVRAECLTEAARIPYGIAGGLTEHERRRLRRSSPRTGAAARVEQVLADGPPPGMTARERAGVGRMLLAAGRSTRQVAGDCGVCPRTAERWATTSPTTTRAPSTSTSSASDGAGERSPARSAVASGMSGGWGRGAAAATGLPSGSPQHSTPRQGHEHRKEAEPR